MKKCFKWTLIIVGILAIFAWLFASFGEHEDRYGRGEGVKHGIQNGGKWMMQQTNVSNHFHHGEFHFVGFAIGLLLCGILAAWVIRLIRKRVTKGGCNLISSPPVVGSDLYEDTSIHGQYLDQWEKNLMNEKGDSNHGNL